MSRVQVTAAAAANGGRKYLSRPGQSSSSASPLITVLAICWRVHDFCHCLSMLPFPDRERHRDEPDATRHRPRAPCSLDRPISEQETVFGLTTEVQCWSGPGRKLAPRFKWLQSMDRYGASVPICGILIWTSNMRIPVVARTPWGRFGGMKTNEPACTGCSSVPN